LTLECIHTERHLPRRSCGAEAIARAEIIRKRNQGELFGNNAGRVWNQTVRIAAKEAGVADLSGVLSGQLAVVTGQRDISAAARALKTFASEFEKPKLKFGYLDNKRLEVSEVMTLADLPSIEVLRGRLLGVLQAPAAQLARLLNTPASQLARVLQARVDKGE